MASKDLGIAREQMRRWERIQSIPDDIYDYLVKIAQYGWHPDQVRNAYLQVREHLGARGSMSTPTDTPFVLSSAPPNVPDLMTPQVGSVETPQMLQQHVHRFPTPTGPSPRSAAACDHQTQSTPAVDLNAQFASPVSYDSSSVHPGRRLTDVSSSPSLWTNMPAPNPAVVLQTTGQPGTQSQEGYGLGLYPLYAPYVPTSDPAIPQFSLTGDAANTPSSTSSAVDSFPSLAPPGYLPSPQFGSEASEPTRRIRRNDAQRDSQQVSQEPHVPYEPRKSRVTKRKRSNAVSPSPSQHIQNPQFLTPTSQPSSSPFSLSSPEFPAHGWPTPPRPTQTQPMKPARRSASTSNPTAKRSKTVHVTPLPPQLMPQQQYFQSPDFDQFFPTTSA